jgi:NADPH:quinone reductase-like Zn-dependent oxidoreductase
VVDVAGGDTLVAALKGTRYGGSVTCCGLVASAEIALNVFPFILRGVNLLGVDSVQCPAETRRAVWERLGGEWKPSQLVQLASEVPLEGKIQAILKGALRGRVLVQLG